MLYLTQRDIIHTINVKKIIYNGRETDKYLYTDMIFRVYLLFYTIISLLY